MEIVVTFAYITVYSIIKLPPCSHRSTINLQANQIK